MTARSIPDALIYAPGAGSGHLLRGLVIAEELARSGMRCAVAAEPTADWVRESAEYRGKWIRLSDAGQVLRTGTDTIVVDTFPSGARGEIHQRVLRRFRRSVFISRFVRGGSMPRDYTEVLDPYPEGRSEWGSNPPGRAVGYLVREDRPRFEPLPSTLTVIDPGKNLHPAMRASIAAIGSRTGYSIREIHRYTREIHGERFLVIGAGYHAFYELLISGADFRAVPLERRYDSQFRRARMWGRALESLSELERWLAVPAGARHA